MDFSDALIVCKEGSKIARAGWPGPWFVVFQKGYPNGIEINQNTAEATGIKQGTVCKFFPYLMFCDPKGAFVPWVATQGDLLANDWEIVPH